MHAPEMGGAPFTVGRGNSAHYDVLRATFPTDGLHIPHVLLGMVYCQRVPLTSMSRTRNALVLFFCGISILREMNYDLHLVEGHEEFNRGF